MGLISFKDLHLDEVHAALARRGLLERGPLIAEQAYRGVHGQFAQRFADIHGLSHRKVARLAGCGQLGAALL